MNNIIVKLKTFLGKDEDQNNMYKDTILDVKPTLFSGGEVHIQLPDLDPNFFTIGNMSHTTATVKAKINSSDDLVATRLVISALYGLDINKTDVIIPYLPYGRQDRICAKGQANSKSVVYSRFFEGQLPTTWDVHSPRGSNCYSIPIPELVAGSKFLDIVNRQGTVLIAPDKGAEDRTKYFRDESTHGKIALYTADKVRNPKTGWIEDYKLNAGKKGIEGKVCVIIDDICDGGATFKILAKALNVMGAKKVILYVTHGIFSKGWKDLVEDGIDEVYTTNSLNQDDDFPRSNIITVDPDFDLIKEIK